MCLHNPCLHGVPVVGTNECAYTTAAITGSLQWGAIMWLNNPTFSGLPVVGTNQCGYISGAISVSPQGAKIIVAT